MIHGNGVGVSSGTVMQLNVPEGVLLNIGNGAFVCREWDAPRYIHHREKVFICLKQNRYAGL